MFPWPRLCLRCWELHATYIELGLGVRARRASLQLRNWAALNWHAVITLIISAHAGFASTGDSHFILVR
jgi:hypothetical protein